MGPLSHELDELPEVARSIEGFGSSTPVTHLLSNRRYTVMLTDSGGGYSSWRGRAVTRWREDATRDCWGSFIYLYDPELDRLWSAGFQPTAAIPDDYHVHFNEECAFFVRRDGALQTTMAVVVAPDDDGELRRITLRNEGSRTRRIEVTSYAEVVLAPQRADIAHPGFSNLFVQTEYLPDTGALLAKRRPRSEREAPLWAMHVMAAQGDTSATLQYETDRSRFVGRGNGTRWPQAVQGGRSLSDTVGNVLDPIFSLRTRLTIPPRSSVTVDLRNLRRRDARAGAGAGGEVPHARRCSTTCSNPPGPSCARTCTTCAAVSARRCCSSRWPRTCSCRRGSCARHWARANAIRWM